MTRTIKTIGIAAVVALLTAACSNTQNTTVEATASTETVLPSTQVVETTTTTTAPETTDETVDETRVEPTTTTTAVKGEESDSERTIDIVMTDYTFEPEQIEVSAGETVTFLVVNDGAVDHEFRLSNAHRIEEHLASGHGDHDEEGGHHEEDGDVFVVLEPGQTDELTVTFPQDTTVYTEAACLLPGHYEAGMKGAISYTDA